MEKIDILLSTHNGRRYLPAQIESILGQSYRHWRLLIRDDGSTDGTPEILRAYAVQHPGRIRIVQTVPGRLGACGSFSSLLGRSTAPYIAFCDQDDIWLPHKLSSQMWAMRRAEWQWGKRMPLLVHSDLEVIDCDGGKIASSFWRYQHLDPRRGESLNRLLVQNVVTGSTVLVNAPMRQLSFPIPAGAIMHDWWMALTAAAFGRIVRTSRGTMRYRQHGENHLGARGWNLRQVAERVRDIGELRSSLRRTQDQAAAFSTRFGAALSPSQREMIDAFAALAEENFFARRIRILQFSLFKAGLLRNCALLAMV